MNNITVKLTEKADNQMSAYLEEQKSLIIDKIIKTKRLPGDEELEITASDIVEVTKNIIYRSKSDNMKKVLKLKLISTVYLISGLIIFFGGIFYDEIIYILRNSPNKIAIMILGVLMFIFGVLSLFTTNIIEKKSISNIDKCSTKVNI